MYPETGELMVRSVMGLPVSFSFAISLCRNVPLLQALFCRG